MSIMCVFRAKCCFQSSLLYIQNPIKPAGFPATKVENDKEEHKISIRCNVAIYSIVAASKDGIWLLILIARFAGQLLLISLTYTLTMRCKQLVTV